MKHECALWVHCRQKWGLSYNMLICWRYYCISLVFFLLLYATVSWLWNSAGMSLWKCFSASILFAFVSLHIVVASEKMKISALPRQQKSQCLLMWPSRIRKHNGFLRLVACELLVNSKEALKQNRKRVLNLWRHKHKKKVQVMVWHCGPHQTFIFPVFSVLAV